LWPSSRNDRADLATTGIAATEQRPQDTIDVDSVLEAPSNALRTPDQANR
jgi:hypothetical protein